MTEKIDLERVRGINPVPEPPDDPEAAERLLRQVLAEPRRPPRRGRRVVFRVATVATTAAVAAAAVVALWPSSGGPSNVIANAAAALTKPDTILHFKARVVSGVRPRRTTFTDETWYSAGGRRERTVRQLRGGRVSEIVSDLDKRVNLVYLSNRNQILRYSQSHPWERQEPALDDLARLFARARDGVGNVRLSGETTVRGVPAYKVRIVETFTGRERVGDRFKPKRITISREVYLDRERFLPVRIVHRLGKPAISVTDYFDVERIPLTPESERLLRMAPHPGAKVIRR